VTAEYLLSEPPIPCAFALQQSKSFAGCDELVDCLQRAPAACPVAPVSPIQKFTKFGFVSDFGFRISDFGFLSIFGFGCGSAALCVSALKG
jgi:hypothetical protein